MHAAEIKAVKHIAHIKELLRVAKEREVVIEREHMVIEMKKLRFIPYIVPRGVHK